MNSDFSSVAKDSFQREPIPYICGLRARIECEPGGEHSTRSDRVTNIGYGLSLEASALPLSATNQEFSVLKNLGVSSFFLMNYIKNLRLYYFSFEGIYNINGDSGVHNNITFMALLGLTIIILLERV